MSYAAFFLGKNSESLRQKAKRGDFPAFQISVGGPWRIEKSTLIAWIEELKN